MRAAILHAPGDIRIEAVPEPTPAAGHALVRVDAVGVCGSDIPRILTKGAHRLPEAVLLRPPAHLQRRLRRGPPLRHQADGQPGGPIASP
jgi:threonine dehydrogenase-like Zn-dependent dehydrogenase